MSTNTIYVFSGSGNCLDIAKNIAKKLGDTDVVLMRSTPEKTDATDSKRVGFVFPCYAGGLPGGVEESFRAVKIAPGTYTFGVTSCSAYPGIGLSVLNSIHPLDFWSVVTHHCSCIWLFPHDLMMPILNVEKAQERSERLAALIGAQVLAGEKNRKAPKANAFNKAEASAWPLLSKKKAEKLRATDACIACGLLPAGGHPHGRRHRPARALPQPEGLRRGAHGEDHPHRLNINSPSRNREGLSACQKVPCGIF